MVMLHILYLLGKENPPVFPGDMVPKEGFEPSRALRPLRPERSASANSATSARNEMNFTGYSAFVNLCKPYSIHPFVHAIIKPVDHCL